MKEITAGMTGLEVRTILNSRDKEYDIRDGGAYVDDSHDDTIAVQSTINEAFVNGGGTVIIPDTGHAAIIDGALQTNVGGINYNSQLYVPSNNFSDQTRVQVTIKGETAPNMQQTAGIGASSTPNTGSRIRSTLINNVNYAAVIGSVGAAGNYQQFNYNQLNIRDLQIQITPDSNNKLTLGGINFRKATNGIISNVALAPYNINGVNSGEPLYNCIGISMPMVNCEWFNVVEKCSVGGFETGIQAGEHSSIVDTTVYCCKYGYDFDMNWHHAMVSSIGAFWNAYSIRFSGRSFAVYGTGNAYVKIVGLQTEWDSLGKWYDSIHTVLDPSNYGRGEITYNCVEAGVGFNNAKFTKSGGANLNCVPLTFTSATDFTVTGARNTGEGALKDLIAKLVAKGIIVDGTTAS